MADVREKTWWVMVLLAVLFVLSFALFTCHNGFPYNAHSDEPDKVRQVMTGDYNLHHPLLLLEFTRVALGLQMSETPDQQRVVETGRMMSAFFAAIAVVSLAFVAWRLRGFWAAVIVGMLLAFHHQFFELSHYMKEDTALLAGVTLVFAVLASMDRGVTVWRAVLLGTACAVAVSGKYIGVVMLVPAVWMLWKGRGERSAWIGSAVALLVVFCAINLPLLRDLADFRASFGREMDFVVHGQKGTTRSVPHSEYLRAFIDNTTPMLWVLLGCYFTRFWRTRRERSTYEWMLVLFPIVFTLVLSCSPKSNDRYYLPATALVVLLAGVGALDAVVLFKSRLSWRGALLVVGGIAVVMQVFSVPKPLKWKSLSEYYRAFQHDDRAELRQWIRESLPADAVIAQDAKVRLPVPGKEEEGYGYGVFPPLTQTVKSKKYVADIGTLEEMQAKGVTHVIVSQSSYGRYFRRSLGPQDGFESKFARHRAFYERLFEEGDLLWARDYGTVIYLHPGLRVYRLSGI